MLTRKQYLLLFFLLIGSVSLFAQFRVTATIIDPDGNPEEYATYRIFAMPDTIHPVVGDITGEDGIVSASLPNAGDYRMQISAMMKLTVTVDFSVSANAPQADLGIINTQFAGETLNEISVTAQRPLVTKDIDRIAYDVSADNDASTSSLREIMKKVPLVSVDDDGTIKVNGSDNFKIYRNGRPNTAFTKNAKDIFAAIPASTIKKIEVITDPGAREDAESSGVILNIVTTSSSSMQGVAGNVGLEWNTNQGPNANAFIMTQVKKLTLSGSGGYFQYLKRYMHGEMESRINYDSTGDHLETDSKYNIGGKGGWFNVEGSLELDSLNLISTSLNGFVSKSSHDVFSTISMFNPLGETEYSYNENSFYRKNGYTDIDYSLDYQRSTRREGETVTLSYRLSHTRQDMDQTTEYLFNSIQPFPYSTNLSDFDLKFFEHTFQLDWSRPFGKKYKLDTGAKYILRTSHSSNHQNLVDFEQTIDEFKHTYNIFGVYADARASYGKWTVRAGLRYEYSRLNADFMTGEQADFHSNLNDVVPNASVAWNASNSSMWKASYNRRIQRPGISYLNPAVTVNPHSVSYGNPNLESTSLDNVLLNYSLIKAKFNLDLTATYSFSNNGTGPLKWTDDDNVTYTTYDNLLHSRQLSFSMFFQWQVASKTSWMFNGNLGWNRYSITNRSIHTSLAKVNGYFYTRIQQQLPWNLTLTVGAMYFSGWFNSLYQYSTSPASNISYSVGLKRSFLKDKTLDVSITANSIGLPKTRRTIYQLNDGTTGYQKTIEPSRQRVTVGISWRFGNLRAQVKKAASTITNDDLQGRKN